MTSLDTYAISVGGSKKDNTPKLEAVTWQQFAARFARPKITRCTLDTCAKGEHVEHNEDGKPIGCKHKDAGYWIPATFTAGRKQKDVKRVSFLVVDADHLSDVGLDETLARLAKYRYVAHATHSDRDGDRCVRILIPLSEPVVLADWKRFWVAAMTALGMPADPSCCDAGRLYYWPSRPSNADYFYEVHDGEPLDVREIARHAPAEEPRIVDSLGVDADGVVGEGQRHAMLVSTAGALRARGAGESEILAALREANKRCSPPKGEAELRDVAKWASEQSVGETWKTKPPADPAEPSDPWKAELAKALADVKTALDTAPAEMRAPLFDDDLVDLLQEQMDGARWLVTGLLTRGGVAMIGGEPKAAIKTWSAMEIAIAVATGTKAFGQFFAELGRVVYLYAEDLKPQVRNRARALLAGAGRAIARGRYKPRPRGKFLDILKDEDLAWIIASVRKVGPVDLLVLDPLRDIHSGEEDKSDSMRDVMRRLRVLAELLGCVVLVVHHAVKRTKDNAGRNAGQNFRGSSAIHGALDALLAVSDSDGDGANKFKTRVVSQVKGARSAGAFDLELSITDDEDGEAVSADWTFRRAEAKSTGKPNKHQADDDAVFAFVRALATKGEHHTRTALKKHESRPIAEKRTADAIDRMLECKRLALSDFGRVVIPPSERSAND